MTVCVSLLAWILLGTLDLDHNANVGYFLTYLITSATFIPSNLVPVWLAANVPTTTGRAVALGLNYMAMNLAGVCSSVSFRDQDAPVYRPALITAGITQGVFVVACLLTLLICWSTVVYQSVKAALINPVKSLRSE